MAIDFELLRDFNSTTFDNVTIVLGATDDAGNQIESTLGNLRIEIDPSLQ